MNLPLVFLEKSGTITICIQLYVDMEKGKGVYEENL